MSPILYLMFLMNRYTAIHLAAQKGTTALFEALLPDIGDGGLDALAKGQLLNATLEGGQTALHLAAQNCNVRQFGHHFGLSRAFLSSTSPHARRVLRYAWCPGLSDPDW